MGNRILNFLKKLENQSSISLCRFKNTTSWIDIKNYLYSKSLDSVVRGADDNTKAFMNTKGLLLAFSSIYNYAKSIFLRRDVMFVGAGSGFLECKGETIDEYLPKEIDPKRTVYLVSADYPQRLWKHLKYIKQNDIVIYSFLIAPFKVILAKFVKRFVKLDFSLVDTEFDGNVSQEELRYIHGRFIVSYYLYKIFLFPFRLKKAYMVSAYSNSPMIAVLKEKGVEIVEIQHGIIGSMHRGYNYAVTDPLLSTPDRIYVYNEFWRDELIAAGYYKHGQIKIKGRLKYDLIDKDVMIENNRFIVFTGQGGFYNEINSFFESSDRYLKQKNVKLLYLPHPNESKKQLAQLRETEMIKILSEKKYITEQYIYNSIAHISVYSSCHFDAIYYKNKTFVFDIMDDNPMIYYIKNYPEMFIAITNISEVLCHV